MRNEDCPDTRGHDGGHRHYYAGPCLPYW